SWSYRHLPTAARRAFRLLGLHPGPDLDAYAAAALLNTGPHRAHRLLERLTRAHLLQPADASRYTMHDLLRAYATELATTRDAEPRPRAAATVLSAYSLPPAAEPMTTLSPAARHRRPHIPVPATPMPTLADRSSANTWLDNERAVLVAVIAHTAHG